jgi:dihydroorotate dehydrogenase subfamily 1
MPDLSVDFCGVRFKNPVVASSAEPTMNATNMKKAMEAGAGGVFAKTMTDTPALRELTSRAKWRFLNERHEVCRGKVPRAFSLYGRSGLCREEPREYVREIRETLKAASAHDAVVVGSIASTDPPGWVDLARLMEDTGVPLLELNYGCPHPQMMGGLRAGMNIGQDIDFACHICQAVSEAVQIPIAVKLTPQVTDLVQLAGRLKRVGATAVTLTNRFIGFVPDIRTGKPLIYGKAGVGGPWIKPMTLRWIHDVYLAYRSELHIAGSNGAYDWRDIVQFIMTGAHIVQMCSAVMVHGYDWLGRQVQGLKKYMEEMGYRCLDEIRGMASDAALAYGDMPHEKARVNPEFCNHCRRCLKVCFYAAMQDGGDKAFVRQENCIGCGGCFSVCPVPGAIEMHPVGEHP